MFRSRLGLTLLLALVFAANLVETAAEQRLGPGASRVSATGYRFAYAMRGLERRLSLEGFRNHDATNRLAVYGYSVSYFLLFPVLCAAVAVSLALRREITGYRVLCLAVALDYLLSLPFFLLMPVPERWAFPDSGAILLSDLWSSRLIESIRPMSSLDNCFPSTHTSLTVIMILICFRQGLRMRMSVLVLGASVILSTFVLGVHWLPDIAAGIAVAWLSVLLAHALDAKIVSATTDATWQPANG
jgi:membrane-associated phospholipid phosphatase